MRQPCQTIKVLQNAEAVTNRPVAQQEAAKAQDKAARWEVLALTMAAALVLPAKSATLLEIE